MRRLSLGLVLLRATGVAALVLLLWNPGVARSRPAGTQPIVLLDASLSMTARWRAALDTVRALAGGQALVWRFGNRVTTFDTTAPADGASRLAPALEAAAARGSRVIVVSDGVVDDAAVIPPDLRREPQVVLLPRAPFWDAFVASVDGQRHVTSTDTVRLRVSYGTTGTGERGRATRPTSLTVSLGGRRLVSRAVPLPNNGVLSTDITMPVSRFPAGWSVVEVRLEGAGDEEPRDDARAFVFEVSPQPAAVILASPPDWETRFLARTLGAVARIPVKTFVETEPGRWRDAATLAPVTDAELRRGTQGARLIVLAGSAERARAFAPAGTALLVWSTAGGQTGDWYVERPAPSPLTAALAGVAWDSLPPLVSLGDAPRDSGTVTALTARLARRGAPRPVVSLEQRDGRGGRRATVAAGGVWRWAFRGGASEEGYRALVAALADWLLGGVEGRKERAVPLALETPNGTPLVWRWTGSGEPRPLAIELQGDSGVRRDTLRFDAAGRAELRLRPGAYRYALGSSGAQERGLVAVEQYSDEWRPAAPVLTVQAGSPAGEFVRIGLRDRWWLFALAIAAFAAEWAWRRRQGLP